MLLRLVCRLAGPFLLLPFFFPRVLILPFFQRNNYLFILTPTSTALSSSYQDILQLLSPFQGKGTPNDVTAKPFAISLPEICFSGSTPTDSRTRAVGDALAFFFSAGADVAMRSCRWMA